MEERFALHRCCLNEWAAGSGDRTALILCGAEDDLLIAFLADQRDQLTRRVAELQKLISFVDPKMAWLRDPDGGAPPPFPR
jgi:hypothetical protein